MRHRREVLAGACALAVTGCAGQVLEARPAPGGLAHYGMIGKISAKAGRRAALIETLSGGSGAMPGNLLYLVAEDASDPEAIWVVELWDSEASHRASLSLPAVQEAIRRGRPLIAGFETTVRMQAVRGLR